jgi:hypothetical protein
MDPAGLAIAFEAARISNLAHGAPIRSAQSLWEAVRNAPVQSAGRVNWPAESRGDEWLGSHLSSQLNTIRIARGRVAQEAVPPDAFREWATTLGG